MRRSIDLDGCLNFRDLGGYPTRDGRTVRWRRLFRSDALHLLTAADIARLRDELGIGDVIDLRSSAEVRSDGRGPLADEAIRFHHLPLFDGETVRRDENPAAYTLADRYFLLAEFAKDAIARVVATLATTDAPAVYHCAAGKDRTGVISAVLLGILGVKDEIIVADYAATQENLDAIIERLMASEGYQTMLSALPPDTLHAQPETMTTLLDRVRDRYGSMRDYARAAGVSDDAMDRLEARLLVR
ncbi:MAG TPA: tyrosine-protein phosphatase [Candidatus Kryptonia bacterium]|nr:tyrosine-protein phosphatase [Candidatus Kryptonia bacterium]